MEGKNFIPASPDHIETRILFVKKRFFNSIENGSKTLEMRVGFGSFLKIKAGDELEFKTSKNKSLKVRVVNVRRHPTLESILGKEDIEKMAPGIEKSQMSLIIQNIFKQEDIQRCGLIVIEFKKIE